MAVDGARLYRLYCSVIFDVDGLLMLQSGSNLVVSTDATVEAWNVEASGGVLDPSSLQNIQLDGGGSCFLGALHDRRKGG
jgi:hypothetical protein